MDTSILLTTNALLSSAAAIVMFVVLRTRKTYPGFVLWTAGVACLALGAAMLVPNALPASWLVRVLRNAMLLGGLMLILRGMLIFREYRVSYALETLLGISFLAVFGYYSLDPNDIDARIAIYCAFAAALSLLTVFVTLWERPAYFGSNDILLALWMSVFAVLSLVRIVHQVGDPHSSTAFEALKGFGSFYAMAQILTVQLVTLTLISMNSQRIEYEYLLNAARLREREEQIRSIGDNLPDGFVYQYESVGGKAHFNYISAGVGRIFPLDPQALMADARPLFELMDADSLQQYRQDEARSARELSAYSGTPLFNLPDQRKVWLHVRSSPLKRPNGSVVWEGVALDITKLMQAESALRHFKAIVESSDDAIIGETLQGTIASWNAGAEKIFGYTAGEAIGQPMRMLLPQPAGDAAPTLERIALGGTLDHFEAVRRCRDGRLLDISATISPIFNEQGQVVGVSTIARDVSARKLAEAELHQHRHHLEAMVHERTAQLLEAQSRAEAANVAKSAFLANMSHEIRTPLHGMLGMAQRLLEAPLPPAQHQQAQVIERSGQLLLGVIDDVLDFSRIESGRLELERVPFELVQLARDAVALFEPRAQAKGLALQLALEPAVTRAWLLGDPLRLSQILNNLLSNAVKFTAAGRVVLQLSQLQPGRWRVAVRDTGIGLSAADRQRIFEPFMQADSSTTRRFGGTGLGLAIVSCLVQLHGGELGVHSSPGRGTEFWFELAWPVAPAPAHQPPASARPAPGPSLAGRRALVAEDNEVNMTLACAILQTLHMAVRPVANGVEAVQAYGQERPDVVLMDMHMPEMDGLDATRRIRALEAAHGWARTPIVALTASALPEDRQRCVEAGMDDVLVKPFQAAQLQGVLGRHCR